MSMDWGPPNYIPEWQDLDRTRTYQQDRIAYDNALEPEMSWHFLDTTGFKVLAVVGITFVAFVCFEAYRSARVPVTYGHHASHVSTHRSAHRKD